MVVKDLRPRSPFHSSRRGAGPLLTRIRGRPCADDRGIHLPGLLEGQEAFEIVDHEQAIRQLGDPRHILRAGGHPGRRFDGVLIDDNQVERAIHPQCYEPVSGMGNDEVLVRSERGRRQSEALPNIKHRNEGTPEVDDPFHDGRRLGQRGDRHGAHHFANMFGRQREAVIADFEAEQLRRYPPSGTGPESRAKRSNKP